MAKKKNRNYISNINLPQLKDIGRLVAEEDQKLLDYYVGKAKYVDRAISFEDPTVFFIGAKGAGKSAILQMVRLLRSADSQRIINISPDELAFSALANIDANTPLLSNAGKNQWVFKSLWDYVLSLEILKREFQGKVAVVELIKRIFHGKHDAHAKRLVEMSISDDGSSSTLTERILQLVKEVEISGEYNGLKIAGSVQLDHKDQNNQLMLLTLVNSVARTLPSLIKHQYHILVDDLDRYWNDTPVQNAFLAALFESLRKLNDGNKLKFAVALRERIYKSLPLEDKDKLRDWVCRVEWDVDSISEMIQRRVSLALDCEENEVFTQVFPPGAMNTLLRRTTGKPREIIRLASLCLCTAKRFNHGTVEDGDIGIAVTEFSEEKIEDIASEFNYLYRGFGKFTRKLTGWPKDFPLDKIHELAIDLSYEVNQTGSNRPPYEWAGVYADDPKGLARILLETGILKFKHNRTAIPEDFDPDHPLEIQSGSWFSVHTMYSAGLKCVGEGAE